MIIFLSLVKKTKKKTTTKNTLDDGDGKRKGAA